MKLSQDKPKRKKVVTMLRLYKVVKGKLVMDYGFSNLRHLYERQGYVVKG